MWLNVNLWGAGIGKDVQETFGLFLQLFYQFKIISK